MPPRNTLLMISLFCSLRKGILLMPLTRRTWLMYGNLLSCPHVADFLCGEATEFLVSRL